MLMRFFLHSGIKNARDDGKTFLFLNFFREKAFKFNTIFFYRLFYPKSYHDQVFGCGKITMRH